MGNATNVLILSCGTRNKIIQYFRKELGNNGIVIAADCSDLAPALYDADKYFVIPRINEKEYLKKVISICNCNKVKGILSLIDPELTLLARNKKEFLSIGVTPIISGHETVELCFDKYAMYKFLATNGFNTPKSYVDKDKFFKDVEVGVINYPVFLKPIKGSASININKAFCKEEVELLFSKYDGLMIQEFIDGIEYGADVYIDMISGEPVAIFTKEKIKMREMCIRDSIKLGKPVIFRQSRPGLHEKIFTLYKFRTMTDERNTKGELLPDESRLTQFGKLLRSVSLDELPELWNVLKGEMSFVGPRPLLVKYLPHYTKNERWRHRVRPGITGLAQIEGRNSLRWDKRLALDVKYAKQVTFFGDLRIIFKTIPRVLKRENILVEALTDLNIERGESVVSNDLL